MVAGHEDGMVGTAVGLESVQAQAEQLAAEIYAYIDHEVLHDLNWPIFVDLLRDDREKWSKPPGVYTNIFPALSCEAAGGDPLRAVPLAAAWLLNVLAGRIFDDWQDGEGDQQPWMKGGAAEATSIGLFALGAANSALSHLQVERETLSDIVRAFGNILALSAKAQRSGLDVHSLTVEKYFAHIAGKTGVVFATAAWAGARIAESDETVVGTLYAFGMNLGMAIQIVDDCEDLASDLRRQHLTLPVAFGLNQTEHSRHSSLVSLLNSRSHESWVDDVTVELEEMDAIEWSMRVASVYQARALTALEALPQESAIPLNVLVSGSYGPIR